MEKLLKRTLKKMKEKNFVTQKEWNRYAMKHKLLLAETVTYFTNKNYKDLRKL